MDDISLSKEDIDSLIDLWQSKRCLWDRSRDDYKDQRSRHQALKDIAKALSNGWTHDHVKRKIESIKAYYRRQKKKLIKTATGYQFNGNWQHFEKVHSFMRNVNAKGSSSGVKIEVDVAVDPLDDLSTDQHALGNNQWSSNLDLETWEEDCSSSVGSYASPSLGLSCHEGESDEGTTYSIENGKRVSSQKNVPATTMSNLNAESGLVTHTRRIKPALSSKTRRLGETSTLGPTSSSETRRLIAVSSSKTDLLRPASRKRPGESSLEGVFAEYLQHKMTPPTPSSRKEKSDILWADNLLSNINEISDPRRRKLLKIDIQALVVKAMREDVLSAGSDTE